MNKAYRYRLYPDREQEILINKTFGCVRFVYNKMLSERKMVAEAYAGDEQARRRHRYALPADYKKEYEWLKEVDSLALANAQLNLQTAFRNYYRNRVTGYPKYKSKHHDTKSYTTNNQKGSIRIVDEKTMRIPKLKDVRIKMHRPIPEGEEIKSATISRTATGKYHISILVEYESEIRQVFPKKGQVIGLDYSAGSLYVDSEGSSAAYPCYYREAEGRLKKAQKKLSKRKLGGKNREKQRRKVAKLHEKVANQRKDFMHKRSRQIVNAWEAVAVEDINLHAIAGCLRLGKSTHDNSFGAFRRMLAYKLAEQGKQMMIIDKWYPSSKRCHICGSNYKELVLGEKHWKCKSCGVIHDRDINAAINIRNEGIRLLGTA